MRIHVVLALALLSAGCGTTPEDRALSGATIGAGAGAVAGAATGAGLVEATVFGAAAGALAGVMTPAHQVDLGEPIWRRHGVTVIFPNLVSADRVRAIQEGLARLGFYDGPLDGILHARVERAIRQYQAARGLDPDGLPTRAVAELIAADG